MVSEYVKASNTNTEPEKVANMVGTFLNKDSGGFEVPTALVASEKVASTVATFLPEDRGDIGIVRVTTKIFP